MKNLIKCLGTIFLLACVLHGINIHGAPKREFRSTWLATVYNIDWPKSTGTSETVIASQKSQMDNLIEGLAKDGFTSLCFQVRSMSDAMYKSAYEPWSSYLTGTRGTDPGWDPLEYVVEKCHSLGMECHAWINPFRWSTGSYWNTPQDNEVKNNNWLLTGSNGKYIVLNPGIPEVRQRVVDVCKDIITHYKVDGFLFDDYFYPSEGTSEGSDAGDYSLWQNSGTTLSIANWRRDNVRKCIKAIYDMVQSVRPDCRFGIGPAGVAGTASTSAAKYGVEPCPTGSDWQYSQIYSDPLAWLYDGTIDYISPQLYWGTTHSTNPFGPLTQWWSYCANHFGRHHYASHSISSFSSSNKATSWAESAKQIELSRQYTENNAPGCVFYSTSYINGPKASGFGDYLLKNTFNTKSLSPVITWKQKTVYSAPSHINKNGNALSWDATTDGNRIIRYTVYAIPTSVKSADAKAADGDGFDAKYLQGVTYTNDFTLADNVTSGYWYAICVYDGFGNESEAGLYGNYEVPSEAATLISPLDKSTVERTQSFEWSNVNDATFSLEISKTSDFASISINKTDITTNSISLDLAGLDEFTTYYWRIKSLQPGKLETESNVFSFITPAKLVAPIVTLVSPKNGVEVEDNVDFIWNKENVDSYILQVSTSSSFETLITTKNVEQSENESTVSLSLPASLFGKGHFYWRVISVAKDMKNGVSDSESFTINNISIGEYEKGYTIKNDPSIYTEHNKVNCENLWMRSTRNDFKNISFESSGALNRGMCASGNYIYVAGRTEASEDSPIYLAKYNSQTGEHIEDLTINGASGLSYYPCNDVIKDSKGHIFVTNLTINASKYPLCIHQIDTETGLATLKASCSYTETSSPRIDHAAIYGDVESGDFYVFAAVAKTDIVVRWTFKDSKLTTTESCTLKSFYPSSSLNLGIAPVIIPVTEDIFFADGGGTAFTRYSFATGEMTDSFNNCKDMAPTTYEANGGCHFALNGNSYLVYAYGDPSYTDGCNFMLAKTNSTLDLKGINKYWTLPETGLGTVNSQTWQSDADFVPIDSRSGRLYLYSPGNGLSAYLISDSTSTGVEASLVPEEIFVYSIGKEIYFSTIVDKAEVYAMNGSLIGKYNSVNRINLHATPGTYIVKAYSNDAVIRKMIMIK